jgi:hypothetical protein
MYKVIITCICIETGKVSTVSKETEDTQALWEKEQMNKFHCAGTSGNIPHHDIWSVTGTAVIEGADSYIKTWSQYKMK